MRFKKLLYTTCIILVFGGTAAAQRVTGGQIALYQFDEGSGNTVNDVSGFGTALPLQIDNLDSVTWQTGSLRIDGKTVLKSVGPATKIYNEVTSSGEFTLEAWLEPANTIYTVTASRIITYSQDTGNINMALRQVLNDNEYEGRVQSSTTGANGNISLLTSNGSVTTELTHVVITRDAAGNTRLYVNNNEESLVTPGGDFSVWNSADSLVLANAAQWPWNAAADRSWFGTFHLVSVYNRALNNTEIDSNFVAGFPQADDAQSSVSPQNVVRNQGAVSFTYTIDNITSGSPTFGRADKVIIANPFTTENIFVSSVRVDGVEYFIKNDTVQPTASGFATWNYDTVNDSLYVRTANFDINSEIVIEFIVNIPGITPQTVSFLSWIDGVLDPTPPFPITNQDTDVQVAPSQIAFYSITPSTVNTTVGSIINLLIEARDSGGNIVTTDNTTDVQILITGTRISPNDTLLATLTAGVINTAFSDSAAEQIAVLAYTLGNPTVSGTSPLITIAADPADHIVVLSSVNPLIAGAERQLRIALEDRFDNRISGTSLTLNSLEGRGYFPASGLATINSVTDGDGVAEALFVSTDTLNLPGFPGSDSINVFLATLIDTTFGIPLTPGPPSYYTFVPSGSRITTAGTTLIYQLQSRDQFGNLSPNTGSVNLTAVGSNSVQFIEGTTRSFGGGSDFSLSVRDTVTGNFTIRAQNTIASEIIGQSGQVTINPQSADHIVVLSDTLPIEVGSARLLQIALEDSFKNRISGQNLLLNTVQGSGYFVTPGNPDTTIQTGSSGMIQVPYTASSTLSTVSDSINIFLTGLIDTTIGFRLRSGNVSYYLFEPEGASSMAAGDTLDFTLTARDRFDNGVVNSGTVLLSNVGSNVTFIGGTPRSFVNDSVLTVRITATQAGIFTFKAVNSINGSIVGNGGPITVNPAVRDHIAILSNLGPIVTGGERLIQIALEDTFNNRIGGIPITLTTFKGNGYFVPTGKTDTTINTSSTGLIEVIYTASDSLSFVNDSILVESGGIIDTTFGLQLKPGSVSYYTFNPPGDTSFTAGGNIVYTLTARDQFGNPAPNSGSISLAAIGGVSVTFVEGVTRSFGGASAITITVTSTLAQSFTVRAANTIYPDIKGASDIVTVNPAAANSFNILSSSNPITVGTGRLLRVRLIDQYNNPIDSASVLFSAPALPSDAFLGTNPLTKDSTVTTNTSGIAEVLFTASKSIAYSPDIIQVSDGGTTNTSINLSLRSNDVSYYTLNPVGDRSFTAGANLVYTLTARDQYGNGVLNTGSVTLSAFGGTLVTFIEGANRNFSGDSVLTVTLTSNRTQSFTVRVVNDSNGEIKGESDLVTVNPAAPDHLTMISTSDPINVRGSRLLRAALEDTYNNRISGGSVTFTIRRGNGYLNTPGNTDTVVVVDTNGVYETPYTASDALTFVSDSIDVTSAGVPLVALVFTLQQTEDNVSYYTFTPSGPQNIAAGGNVIFTITARDQFGNGVLNNGNLQITAVAGTNVNYTEPLPLAFNGDSVATLTVTTDLSQNFTIRAENTGNDQLVGQSGLITVGPDAADHFVVVSNTGPITVGTERLLQVRLEDQYDNPVPSIDITFTATTGDAYFGTPGTTVANDTTDASGLVSVTYTSSSDLTVITDVIGVSDGGVVNTNINLPLIGAPVSYYTFVPAGNQNITAGDSLGYTITARDQYDNAVANNDSVDLSAIGSVTAGFTNNGRIYFGGTSIAIFNVADTTAGTFNVRATSATNLNTRGQSGLITVGPDAADHFVVVSNTGPITVGTERLLQVRLEDQYDNPVPSIDITFTATTGDAYFGTPGTTVANDTTDASGLVSVTYTSSSDLTVITDVIGVSDGGVVNTNINLPLIGAPVSYYTFVPAGNQNITAGDSLGYTITARDQYDNAVANNDSVDLSAIGSVTAGFTNNGRIYFGGTSIATFNVADTTAGTFNVRATSATNPNTRGQSGLITVGPDAADHFVVVSNTGPITVGTERLLQVRLEDQYDNPVPSAVVTFTAPALPSDAYFGTPGTKIATPSTNATGVAEAAYTASSDLALSPDVIGVSDGGTVSTNINLNLQTANVSYYTFTPSGDVNFTAGGNTIFTLKARDQYGNAVANTGSVTLTAVGAAGATFTGGITRSFGGLDSINIQVNDTLAEKFTVRAVNTVNGQIKGESGLITVGPDVADHFVVLSDTGPITVGTSRLLQVRLEDQYDNPVPSAVVTFTAPALPSDAYFGTPGTKIATPSTNATGVAEAAYTASSDLALSPDVIGVSDGGTVSTNINLNLQTANASYYTFTPSGDVNFTAGGNTIFTLKARDQYGNAVANTGSVTLTAVGAAGATFTGGITRSFGGLDSINIQVNDTLAEKFTVRAVNTVNGQIKGESGLITVGPDVADHFVVLSDTGPITVGTSRLLQVRLEDQYDNPVPSAVVTFTAPALPSDAYFGTPGTKIATPSTNATGVAEAAYTASSDLALSPDVIGVSDGGTVSTNINLNLQAANVSYYTFTPSGDVNFTAGGNTSFTLTARDQYGNGVVNSASVILTAFGAAGATFTGGTTATFTNDSVLTIEVNDNVTEIFTVRTTNTVNNQIKGESGLVTVNAAALDYVQIRTKSNNGGEEFGDSTFTAGQSIMLYAAGYDTFANYRSDVSVNWTGLGLINTVSGSGSSYRFAPTVAPDNGNIIATHANPSITADTTGTLTVTEAVLARIVIQSARGAGQPAVQDLNVTADDTLIIYAAGYDTYGNYLGDANANWTVTNNIGQFLTTSPLDSAVFDARLVGAGVIRATSQVNPAIYDNTGSITVSSGAVASLIIRNAPGGSGQEVTTDTMIVGGNLSFYAAGYDGDNNYVAEQAVNWRSTGNLTGFGDTTDTSVLELNPVNPGSGTIFTENSSGWTNDVTGVILVQTGGLKRIVIRTGANNTGVELDTLTRTAGTSVSLYAAGYDLEDNFLGDQNVEWRAEGDSIGFFNTDSGFSNIFNFRKVNSASFRILLDTFSDNSGIVKVRAAGPDSILALSATFFSGEAGSIVSSDPEIQVWDAFMNPVPNTTVSWSTPTDGSLTPDGLTTNELGRSSATWLLRSSIGADSAFAVVPAIPDTVVFRAQVLSSSADSISYISGNLQDSTAGSVLAQPFVVYVEDSLGNPIQGLNVGFQVTSLPQGGGDYQFIPQSNVLTGSDGRASATFQLGSKAGVYSINIVATGVTGLPISFTATANAGPASSIAIFTGNNQVDTVGQVLLQPVVARIFDQYQNLVSGANVIWLPTADGDTLNATTVSDAQGRVQASWRLPTVSGPVQIGVGLSGVDTTYFDGTGLPDIPAGIIAQSGNNTTTFAGSGRPVTAQVLDQYGNTVAGATVRFTSTSGQVANSSVITNAGGLASTIYTTPANLNQSTVRAIARYNTVPVDTVDFLVYGITYVNSSLAPKAVKTDTTIDFSLSYYHPGLDDINLNTGSTTFSFTDGIRTAVGTLSSPATMVAGDTTDALFNGVTIAGDFNQGNYTPITRFIGESAGDSISGVLATNPGELSVSPLVLQSVTLPVGIVSRGDTIRGAGLVVSNNSLATIRNLSGQFIFNPPLNVQIVPAGSFPDSVLAGESTTLLYDVAIPITAPEGAYMVDGRVTGNLAVAGNDLVTADGALSLAALNIISAAQMEFLTLSPDTISDNQSPVFTISVRNSGSASVLLNQNTTSVQFGTQSWQLDGNQAISPDNATSNLRFRGDLNTLAAGWYPGVLSLRGTENSVPYDTTLSIDSLQVQNRAQLILAGVTLSDTTVGQGETGQTLTIDLQNTGEAIAQIASASAVTIQRNSTYSFLPVTTFPISVAGGGNASITYNIIVNVAATTGPDTITAVIDYSDINSGLIAQAVNANVNDIWTVLNRGALNIVNINAAASKVSRGQTGIPVSMDIQNTGEVPIVFGTGDVRLTFSNNTQNTVLLIAPAIPDTLPGLTIQPYSFLVGISAAAATGVDSIGGSATGTDLRTGQSVNVASSGLDSWLVQTQPSLLITNILNNRSQVNSGQQNLDVRMRIVNQGQATAVLDSAGLFTTPIGNTTDTLLTTLDSLAGGGIDTLYFNSDVSQLYSGSLTVDGFVNYLDGNDTTRSFIANGAVSPHIWNVDNGGQLIIDSVVTPTATISLGQSGVLVNAVVSNNGGASVKLDSLRFLFDGQISRPPMSATRISPTILPTLTPGQSLAAIYRINAAATPVDSGLIALDLRAYGTDQNTLAAVSVTGSVKPDSILLQTPANIRAIAIINPTDVLQNEDDVAVNMSIRNLGRATAQINNVFLDFLNGNTFYNREIIVPTIPFDLTGGEDTTIVFRVDVLSNAPLGPDTLSGRVQYFEYNRGLSLNSSSGPLSNWNVQGTGGISVLSAISSRDSVSTGQDSVLVRVRIANSGSNAVIVDSLSLSMIRGTYNTSTLIQTPGTGLNPASTATFDFLVELLASSSTGIETINAAVFGRDSFSDGPVSDLTADTTDTWLIQRAANIIVNTVTPTQVSIGQTIQPTVQLRNTGQAKLVVDTSITTLVSDGFTLKLQDNIVIEGNTTYDLNFNNDNISGPAGRYPFTLNLFGNENGSFFNRSIIAGDSLLVQSPAVLVIDSVVAARDTVSQEMQDNLNIYLRNTGQAALQVDSLTINPYGIPVGIVPALPQIINGNNNLVLQPTIDIPVDATTGLINLTALASGRDLNSTAPLSDVSESVSDSWTVLSRPQIVIDSVYSDTSVALGQNGILVKVDISNNGETPVDITSLTVNRQIGLYTHLGPILPVILSGNSSLTLIDTISVATNSAVGSDTLTASISYTNRISGTPSNLTGSARWVWVIKSSSNLDIVSVSTPNDFVSQGQTGLPVQVRIRNKGSVLARLDALTLFFVNGDTNYVVTGPNPSLPVTIPALTTASLNYTLDINANAFTGIDSLDARAIVTEISTGRVDTLFSALTTDRWVVQQRPLVTIDRVDISPNVASAGQIGLSAQMILNNAPGPNRATASVNPVDLNFLIESSDADTNFIITRLPTPVLPFNLPAGQSISVNFNVDVAGNAPDTLYTVDGELGYQDINDGTIFTTNTANQKDTLEIRTAAGLVITGFSVIPDTVSSGQDSVLAIVEYSNTGTSPAEVRYTSLTFSVANNNFFYAMIDHPLTPFTINGNATDTLTYFIRVPNSISGAVIVTDSIRALDLISGQTITTSAQTSFTVQSPAIPVYVSGSLTPDFTDVGLVEQFGIRVVNLGQSTIDLDSTRTVIRFNGVPVGTFGPLLSGISDQTIGSTITTNDTTDLIFRPGTIPNIPVGTYSVLVDLVGQSNGIFYSQTITTGDVSIGGDLLITGGSVSPTTVIQGQTGLVVNYTVANRGAQVPLETIGTTIEVRNDLNQVVFVDNLVRLDTVDTLFSIENNVLSFQFDAPITFDGSYRIYGLAKPQGLPQLGPTEVATFNVFSGADLVYVTGSLTPGNVVPAENVQFLVDLYDNGTSGINLKPDSTLLTIDFPTPLQVSLAASYALVAQDTTEINFKNVVIPAGIAPGTYGMKIRTYGNPSFNPLDIVMQTIDLTDSLVVVSQGAVSIVSTTLTDSIVSQGETLQSLNLKFRNSGAGTVRLGSLSDITLLHNAQYSFQLTSGQVFPLTILPGDTVDLTYQVNVDINASTGTDSIRARINFTDVRSGTAGVAENPAIYATWRILSKAGIAVSSIIADAAQVSQAQDSLAVIVRVKNTGEVPLILGSGPSIGLQFSNNTNYLVTLSGPAVPDTIGALDSTDYNFSVTTSAVAATGVDQIAAVVSGRNLRTDAVINLTSGYLDSWLVQTPAAVVITSTYNSFINVNSGQQNLQVEMRIRNQGQATALLDTAGLFTEPLGQITDSLTSILGPLSGGALDTVTFITNIDPVFTGNLIVDGFVNYRDGNDTTRNLAASGAVNPHVWSVGTPAGLQIDSVIVSRTTMSLGQSGVAVTARVTNTGTAQIRIDSLRFTFDGQINRPPMSAVRISPVTLPVLASGQGFDAIFNIAAASAPRDSGDVVLNLRAYGTDQITSDQVNALTALQPDTILLQTPADVQITGITNPSSVVQDTTDIAVRIFLENRGNADARIDNVLLDFRNGNNFYNRNIIQPVIPFILTGGTRDTVEFSVDVLSTAPIGIDSLSGRIQYVELNRNLNQLYTSPKLSSWQVVGSGGLAALAVISDADTISTGQQNILVRVAIANSGNNSVRIDSIRIVPNIGLYGGTLYIPAAADSILDSTAVDTFDFYLSADAGSPVGTESLNAAVYGRDTFTGAQVADANADLRHIWLIQRAANLRYISRITGPAGALDTLVSVGQTFNVATTVSNIGQAGYTSGQLRLNVPANYSVALPQLGYHPPDTLTATWNVTALSPSGPGFDNLSVVLIDSSRDNNSGKLVGIDRFDGNIPIRTENAASIASTIAITAPEGAKDGIVSTGQVFTVRVLANFNPAVLGTGRVARIVLPPNYSVQTSTQKNFSDNVANDSLKWNVVVPGTPSGVPDSIHVEVEARDRNTDQLLSFNSDTLSIINSVSTQLALNATIVGPEGAVDGILSSRQQFTTQVSVANSGVDFDNSGVIGIWATNGVRFIDPQSQNLVDTVRINGFLSNTDSVYEISGWLPATTITTSLLNVEILTRPRDVNSGNLASANPALIRSQLTIVPRAELSINLLNNDQQDTIIVWQNQTITLNTVVQKSGIAALDSTGYLRIAFPAANLALIDTANFPRRQSFDDPDEDLLTWKVKTQQGSGLTYVEIHQDTLYSNAPYDVNDGLTAFRTPFSRVDTLWLDVRSVAEPQISASYSAPFVRPDSLTASTEQDSIEIAATVQYDPLLDQNRRVTLLLPAQAGYASQDTSRTRNLPGTGTNFDMNWTIRAPQNPIDWRNLTLQVSGSSTFNPDTVLTVSQNLAIKTVTRARLRITKLDIIDPPGAAETKKVSLGQLFTMESVISNDGVAGIAAGDSGTIILRSTSPIPLLTVLGSDIQKYTEGDTVQWQVQVASSAGDEITEIMEVELLTIPADENTGLPAAVANQRQDSPEITIVGPATMNITGTTYQDTLSTNQNFQVTATFNKTENVTNAFGIIRLPAWFTSRNAQLDSVIALTEGQEIVAVNWNITVPDRKDNISVSSGILDSIQITYRGEDRLAGNAPVAVTPSVIPIYIQPRAQIKLTKNTVVPTSLNNGFVSKGEDMTFTLAVTRDLLTSDGSGITGMAGINGTVSVIIQIDTAFINPDGDLDEKSAEFTAGTDTIFFTWRRKAPPRVISATTISFTLSQFPQDVNSGQEVFVSGVNRLIAYPVAVKENELQITNMTKELYEGIYKPETSSFARGTINAPILSFRIDNSLSSGDKPANIRTLWFDFRRNPQTDSYLSVEDLELIFANVRLVNWEKYVELFENGEIGINKITADTLDIELSVRFEEVVDDGLIRPSMILDLVNFSIASGEVERLVLLVDLNGDKSVPIGKFYTRLWDVYAWDADPGVQSKIADSQGATFKTSNEFNLNPIGIDVAPDNPEEAFLAFPNPFGRGEDETIIRMFLDEASDVQLRIFTITGQLVRTIDRPNLVSGMHTEITWDGRNDRGSIVLNGVYLCQLQIQEKEGARRNLKYMIKIAFIK